jgi:hypothetical protein
MVSKAQEKLDELRAKLIALGVSKTVANIAVSYGSELYWLGRDDERAKLYGSLVIPPKKGQDE